MRSKGYPTRLRGSSGTRPASTDDFGAQPGRSGCAPGNGAHEPRGERRRIVVISPGRDFLPAGSHVKRAGRVPCVENWTPAKGIQTLVAAVARVLDVSLDLVGDAPDRAYAARVRRAIAPRGLASRVRVYGSLGPTALARRYAAASLFALPTIREGVSDRVRRGSRATGYPSWGVTSPRSAKSPPGAAILVTPGRVKPLAAALKMLVTDERSRRVLARRSLLRARQLPTWAASEKRFVRAVRERVI